MTIPSREQFYYVITMPINKDGYGPCDLKEAEKLTWEVWDQVLISHGSYEFLLDAIDSMNLLNESYKENKIKRATYRFLLICFSNRSILYYIGSHVIIFRME